MHHFKQYMLLTIDLPALAVLTACASDAPQSTASPSPTATPAPTMNLTEPDLARGRQGWLDKQCVACHGNQCHGAFAQGGVATPPTMLQKM